MDKPLSINFVSRNGKDVLSSGIEDKNNTVVCVGDIICPPNPINKYKVCFGIFDNDKFYDDFERGVGFYLKDISDGRIENFPSRSIMNLFYTIQ